MNITKIFPKRIMWYFITLFLIMFILYLIFAFYISFMLNRIINNAFNDEHYDNNLNHIISENDYNILNPRQLECEENLEVKTEWSKTFLFVLPFLTDAHFKYSYIVTDINTNEVIYGGYSQVNMELEYTSFPVRISNIDISP